MTQPSSGNVPLRDKRDIVTCRQTVARLAKDQFFSRIRQTLLVTAASELARNTIIYGRGVSLPENSLHAAATWGFGSCFKITALEYPMCNLQ
jgi:hypothetical protein